MQSISLILNARFLSRRGWAEEFLQIMGSSISELLSSGSAASRAWALAKSELITQMLATFRKMDIRISVPAAGIVHQKYRPEGRQAINVSQKSNFRVLENICVKLRFFVQHK